MDRNIEFRFVGIFFLGNRVGLSNGPGYVPVWRDPNFSLPLIPSRYELRGWLYERNISIIPGTRVTGGKKRGMGGVIDTRRVGSGKTIPGRMNDLNGSVAYDTESVVVLVSIRRGAWVV